jgi:hypothetical protein
VPKVLREAREGRVGLPHSIKLLQSQCVCIAIDDGGKAPAADCGIHIVPLIPTYGIKVLCFQNLRIKGINSMKKSTTFVLSHSTKDGGSLAL